MSSITAQTVTPTTWSVTLASGKTYTLTKAQLATLAGAQTGSASAKMTKALGSVRTLAVAGTDANLDPARIQFEVKADGTFVNVTHYANVADALADVVT